MAKSIDRVINGTFAIATAVCAVVLVRREFSAAPVESPVGPPKYTVNWEAVLPYTASFGKPDAPIQLLVFSDFECPFCRRFHESVLPRLVDALPDSVNWRLVHFPLPMHRFAKPAAKAFECAIQQGSGSAVVDRLYAKQDSFGLVSWEAIATDAGVSDTVSFHECLATTASFVRIDSGFARSRRLGINATPGVMINGYLFSRPPADTQLIGAARLLLANGGRYPELRRPRSR